jgi:hypothetical protein
MAALYESGLPEQGRKPLAQKKFRAAFLKILSSGPLPAESWWH